MVAKNEMTGLKNVFLSASVPKVGREFYGTEDVIAIRDSVIALASSVLARPDYRLIWGGHPSITPLITLVLNRFGLKMSERVVLYQSAYYRDYFPPENVDVGARVITENKGKEGPSIRLMREKMIGDHEYVAAVFIGGMKGVREEYAMFCRYHPDAPCFPIASTGAAALDLYNAHPDDFDTRLLTELSYTSLFKEILHL